MKTEMTSIERVDATVHFRKPDRVPVDLHNFQPAAYATGLSLVEVFKDGELLADAMLNAWREFGHDMILLENGTACNAQACGCEVVYRDDDAPAVEKPHEVPIPIITIILDFLCTKRAATDRYI